MKDITLYITEAANKDGMFMGKTSKRTEEDFTFEKGEKVLLIKYTTHRYIAQLRSANYYVSKVGKNSVTIASNDPNYQSTIDTLKFKFDKYGIYVNISYMFDKNNLLQYKSSPIDEGKEKFIKLFKERVIIE